MISGDQIYGGGEQWIRVPVANVGKRSDVETPGQRHAHQYIITELMFLLRDEAQPVEGAMGAGVALYVHLLDLRPRLRAEKAGY